MKFSGHHIAIVFIGVCLTSCNDDLQIIDTSVVDPQLQPYFDAFVQAATARGLYVDQSLYEIEAKIESIQENNVAGQCWYRHQTPNEIIIDAQYWRTSTVTYREFVVFHELGHCYLNRDHLDDSRLDGSCVSIMQSGLGECLNRYSQYTRESYLDELFFGE